MAKKKKKHQGHYCRICGEHKANEKFTGKGHAKHICKKCDALPQERKNELQHINQIDRIAGKYPRSRQDWELLEKYSKNKKYPEAMEFAQMVLGMNRDNSSWEEENDDEDNEELDSWSELYSDNISFSKLDKDDQEEIRSEIRDDIYDFIFYENCTPNEKGKQKLLREICKVANFAYGQALILDDELNKEFDTILKEVVEDLEKEDSEEGEVF